MINHPQTARRHFLRCRKFWTRGLFRGAPVLALCALVLAAVVAAFLPGQWNRWLFVYKYHYLIALDRNTGRLFKLEDGCEPPKNYTGVWRTWHKNGSLATEGYYKNGLMGGALRMWYTDGTPAQNCKYKKGKLHGMLKIWDFSGKLILEGKLENGTRINTWKQYGNGKRQLTHYKHGSIFKKETFKGSERCVFYYEDRESYDHTRMEKYVGEDLIRTEQKVDGGKYKITLYTDGRPDAEKEK